MFFVLKLSKLCNLRCTYCYEFEELGDRTRMPVEGLDHLFATAAEHLSAARGPADIVLHGGEPSILPPEYLRSVVERARERFTARGVPYSLSLQTNLTRLDEDLLGLLEEFDVALGVSLDVFGGERRTLGGRDSGDRVMRNLQRLFDLGLVARRRVGAISVLHGGNVGQAAATFDFYNEIGLSYRILPMFSILDPPERVRHLELSHDDVVAALSVVAERMLSPGARIRVHPLWNHLCAAVNAVAGLTPAVYRPDRDEWAIIVNTDGEAFTHADSYTPEGRLGNVFTAPFGEVMRSGLRERAVAARAARAAVCDACEFGRACSGVHLIEALPSERAAPGAGRACPVADPLIRRFIALLGTSSAASRLLDEVRSAHPLAAIGVA